MNEINVNEMQNPIEEIVPANLVQETSGKGGLVAVIVVGAVAAAGIGYGIYKKMKKNKAKQIADGINEVIATVDELFEQEVEETE